MGNSNAFDYNVYTVWAPGFVSLLLYLLDFVYMDLFVVFGEMLPPMCFYSEDGDGDTHTHTWYEAAVHYSASFWASLVFCCCTITLYTS